MKKLRHFLIPALSLLCGQAALAQDWKLVWQDEFHGSIGPDWVFETGAGGWGNNEQQYYRRENAAVEGDALVITAKREDFGGARYTSARMKTQGKKSFKYGKIEARMSLPGKQGIWPAFWALGSNIGSVGWPASGEIDIMEHINTADVVYGTPHWQGTNGGHAEYGGHTTASIRDYHLYAVEWDASAIRWFVDGRQFHVLDITNNVGSTEEFHRDFFLLLNVAVGGNWPGFNIDEGALPTKMYVDYVRVYEAGTGGGNNGAEITLEAENNTVTQGMTAESCSEGGKNLGYIDANDWVVWDLNVPSDGTYNVQYRVASQNGGGSLQLERAGGTQVYGSIGVPSTGGWQNWRTITQQVQLNAGQQQIAVKALSGGWNLNWVKISK